MYAYVFVLMPIIDVTMLPYRVYDNSLQLMQVSCGHTDTIKTIIHIPERDQVCVCVFAFVCVCTYVHACTSMCVSQG